MYIQNTAIGLFLIFGVTVSAFAQSKALVEPKQNWYNLDLKDDQMFGISMDKAYTQLLKDKKPKPIIVAVIDGGLDPQHEDLKNVLWTNLHEVPGNGIDDDKNGYIDDIHGWNFLGSGNISFEYDNYQIVRDVRRYQSQFGSKDSLSIPTHDKEAFRNYQNKRRELDNKVAKLNTEVANITSFLSDVDLVVKRIGKDNPSFSDLQTFPSFSDEERGIRDYLLSALRGRLDLKPYLEQTKEQLAEKKIELDYRLNLKYDPRAASDLKYIEGKDRFYGNGNIYGNVAPAHGTHVAGIIGAERDNNIGINGVANCIQIMAIRAIPDGDGLDVDEANAIRYAVDNGARVINMSFGLTVNAERKLVQQAVNYALSKDVLFIQAAGNGHDDLDQTVSYPNRFNNTDQRFVDSFIKVAASGFTDDMNLVVPFSNYGKKSVDVFAPGLGIKSTVPGNLYESHSGTSMAAPVVSGLAAVIRAYYPQLTAPQVKQIILRSVIKRDVLQELCITGGVVNAFEAIKEAKRYKK